MASDNINGGELCAKKSIANRARAVFVRVIRPYKPKVGERVRLVSSPDEEDWHRVGRDYEVLRVDESRPRFYWVCLGLGSGIHRDAVWEPVAAQEPTAEPAQPEAPTGVPRITTSAQFRDHYPHLWLEVYAQGCADGMNKAIANLERLVRHG